MSILDEPKPTSSRNSGADSGTQKEETPIYPKVVVPWLGKGTRGKVLKPIETNYLNLSLSPKMEGNVYHYDVEIVGRGPRKLYTRAFLKFKEKYFPEEKPAFDGKKSAYSRRQLKITNGEFVGNVTVIHPELRKEFDYTLTIKPTQNMLISIKQLFENSERAPDPEAKQALEIILKVRNC